MGQADEAKLLRTSRLRADTTVVPAAVSYPTDSGLLARGDHSDRGDRAAHPGCGRGGADSVAGPGPGGRDTSHGRSRRSSGLRTAAGRNEAQAAVWRITGELVGLAERAAAEAEHLLANARRALRRAAADAVERPLRRSPIRSRVAGAGGYARAVNDLTELLTVTRRIAAQTRPRLSGVTPDGATRHVSLHDPDARPIAKGWLGRPVEFGYRWASPATPKLLRSDCMYRDAEQTAMLNGPSCLI